jgi:hypothetical protein
MARFIQTGRSPTGAGDHQGPDRRVGGDVIDHGPQGAAEGTIEGVQPVGPVEGDREHPVVGQLGAETVEERSGSVMAPP